VKHGREAERAGGGEPSAAYLALVGRSRGELEEVLLRGARPDLDRLAGWEFRGMNTPAWARAARIRKFAKGFERRGTGELFCYNRPVRQDADQAPWQVTGDRFGWYRVGAVDPTARDNAYLHAALLDYGRGGNRPWSPTGVPPDASGSVFRRAVRWGSPSRGLRDYLVEVDGAGGELYLGKAYYALGPTRVAVGFFVLERLRPAPE